MVLQNKKKFKNSQKRRLEIRKTLGEGQHSPPTLAVNVWCNWANHSQSWSCKAIVKFVIKSRELDFVRNFEHVFSAKQPFVNWTRLLEPGGSYGRGREEDSLEIEAQICVNDICGYGWDLRGNFGIFCVL